MYLTLFFNAGNLIVKEVTVILYSKNKRYKIIRIIIKCLKLSFSKQIEHLLNIISQKLLLFGLFGINGTTNIH